MGDQPIGFIWCVQPLRFIQRPFFGSIPYALTLAFLGHHFHNHAPATFLGLQKVDEINNSPIGWKRLGVGMR